ncbi:MAG: AEC family transporter [Magnetococcales bacterium]|nr:AEC family transporter [Magnetococcales bacterium]MBF0347642.1 AEC family transporter [Magnetococcales bacterium]MBF0632204.1 AEC family transporter [Magnetococcales bacterium]
MGNLSLVVLLLFSGMALRHLAVFPRDTPQALNQYVIHISLPALVLVQIPRLSLSTDLMVPVIIPWVMLFFSILLIQLLSRHQGWSREVTGCLMLTVPLGNTSFLGIPMIEAMFGPTGVPYGVLYDQTGSFLALSTYGAVVVTFYQANLTQRPSLAAISRRIFTFPAFIALWTAVLAGQYLQTLMIQTILQRLADTLVPVVMVAVGFNLKPNLPRPYLGPLLMGLGIKMIVAPALALGICLALNLMTPPAIIAIFEAGMPPMITAGAIASAAGLAVELAAAIVGLGIFASLILLPLLAAILKGM